MSPASRLLVHAHCYQPPREDPWLELVPREPSAAPDHDWNVRITRECYAPLGAAPVLDANGRIRAVINCWEWLSFDVGPTLVHWLERHAPAALAAMVTGDRAAIARRGHGTAIAAPYHHLILPLASRRDKRIEIRWGIREFARIFGRTPRGMWLPETAVDLETLEVLAEEGITFTILAPHQVRSAVPGAGTHTWRQGRHAVTLITYDGGLSHDVAFGDLLKDAGRLAAAIEDRGPPISVIAVDGETFGHHHRFGDLGIAATVDRFSHDATASMISAEELAATTAATEPAELVASTSWSCAHGVERWRSDCGCRMDGTTSQQWRAPLRIGLETLSAEVSAIVAREWPAGAGDLDEVLGAAGPELQGTDARSPAVRRLLELERHRLAMFTSCAWFFDDLARIEPRIVLRHAARALDLVPPSDRAILEPALLALLGEARANDPVDGNGATIWERDVMPGRLVEQRIAAGFLALREFEREQPIDLRLPSHDWRFEGDDLVFTHRRTGEVGRWRGEVITMGVVASRIHVRNVTTGASMAIDAIDLPEPVRDRLATIAAAFVLDATLDDEARRALEAGELEPADARRAALRGALDLLASLDEGLDVLLHAVIDLYALAGEWPTLEERAAVWQRLASFPASPARSRLAERLELVLPEGT